jgi:hypothetical protein
MQSCSKCVQQRQFEPQANVFQVETLENLERHLFLSKEPSCPASVCSCVPAPASHLSPPPLATLSPHIATQWTDPLNPSPASVRSYRQVDTAPSILHTLTVLPLDRLGALPGPSQAEQLPLTSRPPLTARHDTPPEWIPRLLA